MEHRSNELELKDLDRRKGEVAFYFAPFGSKDNHGDTHSEEAFDNVIKSAKRPVLHFRDHIGMINGFDHNEIPGKITTMDKDQKGAFAVSKLALKTVVGNDVMEQYEAGLIIGHSYGADPRTSKFKTDTKGGRILLDRDVYEVSSLTMWPASDKTPVISIKSLNGITDILDAMTKVNKALHSGNMSDEAYLELASQYAEMKILLEKKAGFADALGIVRCWNCHDQLISSAMKKDGDNVICDNCQQPINPKDGSKPANYDPDGDNDQMESKSDKILSAMRFGPSEGAKKIAEAINLDLKKDFSDKERQKLAESGAAMPDGSFPIQSQKDLENAIADWGRAGSKPSIKQHIIKRAKALGLEKVLPENWK